LEENSDHQLDLDAHAHSICVMSLNFVVYDFSMPGAMMILQGIQVVLNFGKKSSAQVSLTYAKVSGEAGITS
jgi:hypothetical protein